MVSAASRALHTDDPVIPEYPQVRPPKQTKKIKYNQVSCLKKKKNNWPIQVREHIEPLESWVLSISRNGSGYPTIPPLTPILSMDPQQWKQILWLLVFMIYSSLFPVLVHFLF